jgi:gluconolactonase
MTTTFKVHDDRFLSIIGSSPSLELIFENNEYPFAHEAGVFIPSTNELFITSNQFRDQKSSDLKVIISRCTLSTDNLSPSSKCEELHDASADVPMANGGVNYNDNKSILFCGQGDMTKPSGLYKLSVTPPYETELLVSDFYGRPFNSVNDVITHSDGSIWFTDPSYGYSQGYRPYPQLPNQVYRFNPKTGNIRAVADGLGRPNGLCFSPDEKMLYITDTDWIHAPGVTDDTRVSSIYAYDVATYHCEPFLVNRRLFAMADTGIPDGIKCDMEGNVYSGCGDGVHIWSPGGVLLGRILVRGGVANFCFGRGGEMFLLNENKLWKATLRENVKSALLGI